MNYKLIYKARQAGFHTDSKSNLEVQYMNAARAKAGVEHEKYLEFLTKQLGHSDFEVTNIMCMADGIISHVYEGPGIKGLGKRKCVFCGCDDFED